jgi:hypothetical protein
LFDIKEIYTKNINWLKSATRDTYTKKQKSLNDGSIEFYINSRIMDTELLTQNIIISKISQDSLQYYYKLLDNTYYNMNENEEYRCYKIYQNILDFNNNNNTLTLFEPIDNDTTEISQNDIIVNLWLVNNIDTELIFDSIKLFNNVKQLKNKLLANSITKSIYIFNYTKPWNYWSLLNGINKVNNLSNVVNNIYLKWDQDSVVEMDDLLFPYKYLTNQEVLILKSFLKTVNKSVVARNNYILMRNEIEPLIINNLQTWLNNPSFFLDVVNNVNTFLYYNGYDVIFDGNNIIFNNDTNPEYINIDGVNEISSYISNEFTFDEINNIVYRNEESYTRINVEIGKWINQEKDISNFGVSVHKLLRYLKLLGEELKELLDNFSKPLNEVPEYIYNNPLKFIINKLWEEYKNTPYLNKLDKQFNDELVLKFNFNETSKIYSSVNYLASFVLQNTGINSIIYFYPFLYSQTIYEFNIGKLSIYEPNIVKLVDKNVELITKPLYPYKINFEANEITTDATYSIDFLNGKHIATDLKISNEYVYPDQLNFYSEYNIKPSEFIVVKQTNEYNIINSTLLGQLYGLEFGININNVDQIYYRNYNLTIISKNNNLVKLLIPLSIYETENLNGINTNDLFKLKNSVAIRHIIDQDNKQYLDFYSLKFNFIENNTLLKTEYNLYLLNKDSDNKYYIEGSKLDTYNVDIINLINPTSIVDYQEILYEYELYPKILNSKYNSDNNILVPLEFKLQSGDMTITPIKVNVLNNNKLIFYVTISDNNLINDKTYNWNKIVQNKRLGQDIINKINEYLSLIELYYGKKIN